MDQSESGHAGPVASPLFTALLLSLLAAWTVWGVVRVDRMRAVEHPNRALSYAATMLFEWCLFGLVTLGLRRRGIPLAAIMGARWRSAREVLHDIGIGAAFWGISFVLLAFFGALLRVGRMARGLEYLIPEGPVELTMFVALSITAGICEETIFRGFLQRQFTAWTRSVPAGLVISAIAFGAGHAYQGPRRAVVIGIYGAMFGVLAHRRRNLRPGMMAHAWQDTVSGVVGSVMRRYVR